jgi:cytochrome c oxidase assembly protein subunit 15
MVVVGGYVRLNKAGLSMVKWDLTRIYTPKTDQEWKKEFIEYKTHPQFKNDFPKMTIEGFKNIYLLEHYHRQLGKVLGTFFLIPALIFNFTKIHNKKMRTASTIAGLLIITQGIIGIWMVKSGLNENLGKEYKKQNVRVSPYRLATHFTFGIFTYCYLLSYGLFLISKPQIIKTDFNHIYSNRVIRRNLMFSLHLAFFTAIAGSLLAGHDAGKITNTFPKMGDVWYPTKKHYDPNIGYVRNNLENEFIVHFNHRVLATLTVATVYSMF